MSESSSELSGLRCRRPVAADADEEKPTATASATATTAPVSASTDESSSSSSESGHEDGPADLSESQTETLLHYQQISGLKLGQCRRQLDDNDWDLQRATDRLFGQHGVEDAAEDAAEQQPERPPPALEADANARVVRARQLQPASWGQWLNSLLYFPFRFLHYSLGSLLRFVVSLLRPVAIAQRRPAHDPVGDVRRFVEEFERDFGASHPPVRLCSYSQALDSARSDLRFLLVYLHAESHQDTERFCREVLTTEAFAQFLEASNVSFWMCSVSCPEGARVSQALRETSYPFLALIVLKQSRMTVVARFDGPLTLEQLLAELDAAVTDFGPYLAEERARRESLEVNRRLIEEQDQAFAEALRRDREREQRKLEEEAERSAEDAELRRREAARQEELQRLRDALPSEPPEDSDEPIVKLSVRLPGASERLERRFRLREPLQTLHHFVRLQERAPANFSLFTNFPRRELPGSNDPTVTFADAGMTQSEVLFVTDNDD